MGVPWALPLGAAVTEGAAVGATVVIDDGRGVNPESRRKPTRR